MIIVIIKIVILRVTDSYIIIKSKDNDNDDEKNAQNKDNIKKNYKKKQKTNTITTNKTLITDKTLAGEERKKYLLHPNYKKTTLSNMQRKHFLYTVKR